MTVEELLGKLSAHELTEWHAWFQLKAEEAARERHRRQ